MFRIVRTLAFVIFLSALTAAALLLWLSPDPMYTAQAWLAGGRFHGFDGAIREVAGQHKIAPELIKAIVWRESAFHTDKMGASGERGLMQVGEAAGGDWAKAEKLETFVPTDLFDSRIVSSSTFSITRRAHVGCHKLDIFGTHANTRRMEPVFARLATDVQSAIYQSHITSFLLTSSPNHFFKLYESKSFSSSLPRQHCSS